MKTIRKIRLALNKGMSIREAPKQLCKSRNTIRKVLRGGATSFVYRRREPHYPALGGYIESLKALLETNAALAPSSRRTMLSRYEEAVNVACELALKASLASKDAVLNILCRTTEDVPVRDIAPPEHLRLLHPPQANCAGYELLLEARHGA